MKLSLTLALVVGAAALGAGGTFWAQQAYWDQELKSQVAEKDRRIAELQADLAGLRTGLANLHNTNKAMQHLVELSLGDTADVAKSNQSSLEKLRSIIVRLQKLQADLKVAGAQP